MPLGPVGPVDPVPVGPVTVEPLGPVGPVPDGPVAPVGPVGSVDPAPVGPVPDGPVGPVVPVGPVAPPPASINLNTPPSIPRAFPSTNPSDRSTPTPASERTPYGSGTGTNVTHPPAIVYRLISLVSRAT